MNGGSQLADHLWRRVLITGAAGRIGTVLRQGLRGRHGALRLHDRRPVPNLLPGDDAVIGDLTDSQMLKKAFEDVDALVHLAGAPDARDFEEVFDANLKGLGNVFSVARDAGVRRIVFASTNHVFGMYPLGQTVSMLDPPRPDSFYGVSKVFGETMLAHYFDCFGIESVSIRIGSFTERPYEQRHLATWLSHTDAIEIFDRGLRQPSVGATVVFGISGNTRRRILDPNWHKIGFTPKDDAENWVEKLRTEGVDVDRPEWQRHGGMFERPEY